MKYHLFTFVLACLPIYACFAQASKGNSIIKPQRVIMLTGGGLQLSKTALQQAVFVSIETPLGDLWHLGVQGGYTLSKPSDGYFPYERLLGGFEAGGFAKYFLHGRYSNRKSELYFGPEIRLGTFHSEGQYFGDFFPSIYLIKRTQHTQKYLIRCGAQWRPGKHFVFEIAIPLGWEETKTVTKTIENDVELPSYVYNYGQFIALPTLQLGFAF